MPERDLRVFSKTRWTPDPFFSCGENPDSTRIQVPELNRLFSLIGDGQEIQQFRVHLLCHGPGQETLVLKTLIKPSCGNRVPGEVRSSGRKGV